MKRTAGIYQVEPVWLAVLKNQIETLRFGTVHVVVHEAKVVQIEKTEKVRFDKPEREPSSIPVHTSQQPWSPEVS